MHERKLSLKQEQKMKTNIKRTAVLIASVLLMSIIPLTAKASERGKERPAQRNLEKDRVQKGSQWSDRNRPLPSASKNLRLCRYHQVTYIAVGIIDLHTHGSQPQPISRFAELATAHG